MSKKSAHGFSLIELLVVVAIIAILSVIGITLFSNVQKNARDARRRTDIDAIANALESYKDPSSQTYTALATGQFVSGKIPEDPNTGTIEYCAVNSILSVTPWTSVCPPPVVVGTATFVWAKAASIWPPNNASSWTICASLENPAKVYCKSSTQ